MIVVSYFQHEFVQLVSRAAVTLCRSEGSNGGEGEVGEKRRGWNGREGKERKGSKGAGKRWKVRH